MDSLLGMWLVVWLGLFNPYASVLADVSLLLQIVVLVLVSVAMWVKMRENYKMHGTLMALAVGLHTVTILVVMLPSLGGMGGIYENLYTRFALVTIIHSIAGSIAEILGLFLVGAWAFSRNVNDCFKRKQVMRVTIVSWVIGLVLGIYVYVMLYVPALIY